MMDTNGDKIISREEFTALLDKSLATAANVNQPNRSHAQLMSDLLIYIDKSSISLQDYFVKPPKMDGEICHSNNHQSLTRPLTFCCPSGRLDHVQIADMVKLDIADLNADESKYILAYFCESTTHMIELTCCG